MFIFHLIALDPCERRIILYIIPFYVIGTYEIGARTGEKGDEYISHTGPPLIVYNENGRKVNILL
jgi:hypothetical protein